MPKIRYAAALAVMSLSGSSLAAERTVTLSVEHMTCAGCPHVVKGSLAAVPGVSAVVVSFKDKTAAVTYDDPKATISALIRATTDAGYPSAPKS
jgi:periplasmic mercuric ion binding protein